MFYLKENTNITKAENLHKGRKSSNMLKKKMKNRIFKKMQKLFK